MRIDPYEPSWHGVDPRTPEMQDDPFPLIRELRQRAPVHLTPLKYWRISRYEDCSRVLHDIPNGVRHSDGTLPWGNDYENYGEFMLQKDPPDHTRLRKLFSKTFTPRAVDRWRERAREIAEECVDQALENGQMDVIAELALPVPSTLICEMLGVPVGDRDQFTDWTAAATYVLAGDLATEQQIADAKRAGIELAAYFHALAEERRKNPGQDLLSVLIQTDEDGDQFAPGELLVQSIGLLIAGFETTIGLIGNGIINLIRHPSEIEKLRKDPTLIKSAVEECLRYEGPVGATIRVIREDADFNGVQIPADSQVLCLLWGANRDPERFPDPECFDVERSNNTHLGFGGGPHLCLGLHLARLETQLAIGTLVARTKHLELVSDHIEWGRSLFRVPMQLPIKIIQS